MKILLMAVNAKYIHSNLAVYSLQSYAARHGIRAEIAEYTINQQKDEILRLSLIHISEPTRRVVISYAVFCLKKIFFNDTATTEIYTRLFVGSVRCV